MPRTPNRVRRRARLVVESLEVRSLLSASAVIDWSMAPRIVADPAHGNQPDLPNTSSYVNPAEGYEVLLDASKSTGINPRTTFSWTITPQSGSPIDLTGEAPNVDLPEGTYSVSLEADHLSGSIRPVVATTSVVVKDVLIVSIGDSYASGEGNPVVPGYYGFKAPQWAYSPDPSMNAENAAGHRSTIAGPAQFALQLQAANPHEAVTFVSVADTGSTIAQGLLGPLTYSGSPAVTVPAQVAEVAQIVGSHPIDALTISIGGNDIGFSTRLEQLVENTLLGSPSLATIKSQFQADLATLSAQYALLGQAIQALNPGHVMITEYPDILRDAGGNFAPITFKGGGTGFTLIGADAARFAYNNIQLPLNQAVQSAATANGWAFVGGIASDFRTHGYPSTDPWINTIKRSFQVEGSVSGAFHPNAAGHQDIARNLLSTYEQVIGPPPPGVVHVQALGRRALAAHRHPAPAARRLA